MLIKKYIKKLTIGLLIAFSINAYAQNSAEQEAKANRFVYEKNYSLANEIYVQLLKKDSLNTELIYKYANSLRLQLNYSKANKEYSKLLSLNREDINIDAYFYFAKTAKQMENIDGAIFGFNYYIKNGKSNLLRRQAEQELQSCRYIQSHKNDSIKYTITHLPPPINTPYSEFNAIETSSTDLVFSRYEAMFTDSIETVFEQNYFSEIYASKQTNRGWKKPKIFTDRFSSNRYFTANISFTKNKREAYLTRCIDEGGQIGRCNIYYSKIKNGKWTKPKALSKINLSDYTTTHPHIVEFSNYRILYFSSNRPNGFGGNDIWYALIKNNKVQQISNLGSIINTKGNEITPFYDKEKNLLFFSSDSLNGYGGFDIYKATGALSSWKDVNNIGSPMNSPSNDLYYTHKQGGEIAYISSNRKGSYYHGNAESCCTDIYRAVLQKSPEEKIELKKEKPDTTTVDSVVIAIHKLLPLSLYFDNDMPNPKSTSTTTNVNYKDLLAEYISKKAIYKTEYSKGLDSSEIADAKQQIEIFFNQKVEHGFEDLEYFGTLLKDELSKDKTVKIKIRGYASPLNSPEYNLALSKRRIASLKNYIREYENGFFKSYMNQNDTTKGSLQIFENPLGDSQSIGLVSDNPNDKRNSIYSREAALQRKIQIIMYSSGAETNDSMSYPLLRWTNSTYNLGKITKGESKTGILYFTNQGKAELKIENITSECKCIQLKLAETTIQPNAKGKVYFLIKTDKLENNKYRIKITTQTNELDSYGNFFIEFEIISD